jgi:hypothetical protein
MTKISKTKQLEQQVKQLEQKLLEAKSQQASVYHTAARDLKKASVDHMMASGVIITITKIGGEKICEPFMIRDGLSHETISAMTDDMIRSYDLATMFKPKA